jgi:hypothetical protein
MGFGCCFAHSQFDDLAPRYRWNLAWRVLFILLSAVALPVSAQMPQPPPKAAPFLAASRPILIGANQANDALSIPVRSGPLALDLYLQVDKPLPKARMQVTNFLAQAPSADVLSPKLTLFDGDKSQLIDVQTEVSLAEPGLHHLRINGEDLRAGTTYKGWLFLAAEGQNYRWEVTLAVGGQGIIAVDPIGTLKFSRWPWSSITGDFSITLRDKPEGGPYRNLRVRFEANGTAAAKTIASNFSLDTFTFWEKQSDGNLRRVDLEQRTGNLAGVVKSDGHPHSVDLPRHGQRTFQVNVLPLSPGEYTGGLRFAAADSADEATDSKLPLTIQVRHRWPVPVIVILFGSLLGWYSSKYVVAVRKANELARQVRGLRARVDYLARPNSTASGWQFPGEATSYGMARVRVVLSQLARLTVGGLPMLVREEDIRQQQRDAEQRLIGLESLQATRLRVQPAGNRQPAAQRALGRLLRHASDRLSRPTFDPTQQNELTKLLDASEAWLIQDPPAAKYREALIERLQSDEIPVTIDKVVAGPSLTALAQLQNDWPTEDKIRNEPDLANLKIYDQKIAKLALLWREQKLAHQWGKNEVPWVDKLAQGCIAGAPLEDLFRSVDEGLWAKLKRAADPDNDTGTGADHSANHRLQIVCDASYLANLQAFDLIEVRLTSNDSDFDSRIVSHPLRVVWRIVPTDGNVRTDESDGLTLVQYFSSRGKVKLQAFLRWQGHEIPVKHELSLMVAANPDFDSIKLFSGGFTEWVVLLIAAGFAIATAMESQYDSTFGSFSQYLALFVWAAGAGTGGNLFKQLGTASTPGGQTDAALPTTTGATR